MAWELFRLSASRIISNKREGDNKQGEKNKRIKEKTKMKEGKHRERERERER